MNRRNMARVFESREQADAVVEQRARRGTRAVFPIPLLTHSGRRVWVVERTGSQTLCEDGKWRVRVRYPVPVKSRGGS